MKKIGKLTIGILFVLAFAACGRNQTTEPTAPAAPTGSPAGTAATSAADAQAIYKQSCVSCHAADLSGGVGPNLQHVGARLSTDEISARIHNGKGGMPAFKTTLNEDQIAALVQWLGTKR